MTTATTSVPVRLDFDTHAPAFAKAMGHLDHTATKELDRVDFDAKLRELVRIRASQLNGCAYCIDMHTKDARAAGETEQRLYGLPAWREAPFYSARERAALLWTEAITNIQEGHASQVAYDEARREFDEAELVKLTFAITTINSWNRIAI